MLQTPNEMVQKVFEQEFKKPMDYINGQGRALCN